MKMIASQIKDHLAETDSKSLRRDYYIFFVPRRTMICERVLEDEGVYNDILDN